MRARAWSRSWPKPLIVVLISGLAASALGASPAWADLSGTQLSIVAGNGNFAPPSPGPATRSALNLPYAVAVDRLTGDLYIADSLNNRVEKVSPAGKLSIVAGDGRFRPRPRPGPAKRTDIRFPQGVAVDPRTGDLYIADGGHDMVEEVSPAGMLSIVAGTGVIGPPTPGPATSSELGDPGAIAVDPRTGDLYIADDQDNVIERVNARGRLSIVAGTGIHGLPTPGPATRSDLWSPDGVAIDPRTGDLYIADNGNEVIERVTPRGTLSIIAGTGAWGPPTPGPATSSDLHSPEDLAVDARTGDLYIADCFNNMIEQVTPAGVLSIVAGTGLTGPPTPGPATSSDLDLPGGVAVDPATDDLYIADSDNSVIEQIGAGP